ncbi:hypothetical protein B2J88_47290 [Rhodococcus sp. SRB_17]|nr:hypothetical protein [Rhodococcus sp. SRB_17]
MTHRSGSSIGEHLAQSGNRKLNRALSLSAALHDSASRSYYDCKRAECKKHAALICLARRRCDVLNVMLKSDVLNVMLKNKTLYLPNTLRCSSLTETIGTPRSCGAIDGRQPRVGRR